MECPDLSGLQLAPDLADDAAALAEHLQTYWSEFERPAISAASNGRLPAGVLSAIPGGRLEKAAARRWNAMRAYIGQRHGVWIAPLGSNSSYRTYAAQQGFWNLYRSGRGNVAAYPGTSNHGWGRAVDVASQTMAYYIRRYGARFGWSWAEGRRVGEWWHMTYVGGGEVLKPKPSPYRFNTREERAWISKLLYHRRGMRRQERTGRGRKWEEHLKWARYYKAKLIKRRDRLTKLGKAHGWSKRHRGIRRKVIARLVA